MTVPAEQLPTLIERMIRIEAKLDTYNQNHADHEGRIRLLEERSGKLDVIEGRLQSGVTTFSDHESRLRGLEQFRWKQAGAYATVGIVGGLLGSFVGPLLGH